MQSALKVSIVTVCYNSNKTIEKTIQSVINQSYDNIEYIIIDGGSTDGTIDIIKKYDDEISYWISELDNGLYDAMNKGIKVATGEVIGIINSDDWYDLDTVKNVVQCFNNKDVDIVHGKTIWTTNEGINLFEQIPTQHQDMLIEGMIYNHTTFFVKKELYDVYGSFDCRYKIAADYDFLLRVYEKGAKFYYLKDDIGYFRFGGLSSERFVWRCATEVDNIAKFHAEEVSNDIIRDNRLEKLRLKHNQNRYEVVKNYLNKRMKRTNYAKKLFEACLNKNKSYVVFGTGALGMETYRWFDGYKSFISYYIDNSKVKWGKFIDSFPIYSPEVLNKSDGEFIIIASNHYHIEMAEQLENMGFVHKKNYLLFKEFQEYILEQYIKNISWIINLKGIKNEA